MLRVLSHMRLQAVKIVWQFSWLPTRCFGGTFALILVHWGVIFERCSLCSVVAFCCLFFVVCFYGREADGA